MSIIQTAAIVHLLNEHNRRYGGCRDTDVPGFDADTTAATAATCRNCIKAYVIEATRDPYETPRLRLVTV